MTNVQTNAPVSRLNQQQADCSRGPEADRRLQDISDKLLAARKSATALSTFPGDAPSSLQDAYFVQRMSLDQWPGQVSGWKVGGIPTESRNALGADWLIGPIFKSATKRAEAEASVEMPVFNGGFAAIEPELVVQLGESRADDRMFIGAEIASSPVPAINDHGPTAVVCDFGNNNGLLIGAEIPDWRKVEEDTEVAIWIDGEMIGKRVLQGLVAQASDSLQFCLDHAARQGRKLPPGTFVSTGAITGIHEAVVGAQAKIEFGQWGTLSLRLTGATALSEEQG